MNHDNIRLNEDKYPDKSHFTTLSREKIEEVGSMSEQKDDSAENDKMSTDKMQEIYNNDRYNFESDFKSSKDNGIFDTDDYLTYQTFNIANYIEKQNEFINLSYYNIDNLGSIKEETGIEDIDEENCDSNQVFDEDVSKYHCKKCNKSFDVFKLYEKHIFYRHTGIKRHQCEDCDYATNNLSHLKRHVKTHVEQHAAYNCLHCSFTCESSRSLKKHAYTHENIRPYKCPCCPYASITLNHLVRHKLIHC